MTAMPALALWIPYAIAIGAVVALVAALLERPLRLADRPTRHLWLGALWLALVVPALAPWVPRPAAAPAIDGAPGDGDARPATLGARVDAPTTSAVAPVAPLAARLERPLAIAWATATTTLLAAIALAHRRVRRRVHGATVVLHDGEPLRLDDHLGPAAIAGAAPAIVVPRWALELEPPLLALLVRHEREHLRARDPWALVAALLAVALVPWSPAAWWMCRRHRLAIELDCDRRTAGAHPVTRARYAALLLHAATRPRLPRPVDTLVVPAMASHLTRRITMLTAAPARPGRRALALVGAGVLAAVSLGFALPRPARVAAPPAEFAGIYLFTIPPVARPTHLAPDREFTYLRLAPDGRSRYENVTIDVDGERVAPTVETSRWSTTPWRVEPAAGTTPTRLCWELPTGTYECSDVRRDVASGDLTLVGRGAWEPVLRRVVR